jgi:hypothetical protein
MTTYYRVSDAALRELSAEQYAALAANKRADLRLYVIDVPPVPSANQIVVDAGIVVGAVEAHKTWALRDKTAAEIESEALLVERAQIDAMLADIVAQRAVDRTTWDGYTANQLRAELWRDRQALLRFANFLARRVKQEIAQ